MPTATIHDLDCNCPPADADQARLCTCPNDGTGPACLAHPGCPIPCTGHYSKAA